MMGTQEDPPQQREELLKQFWQSLAAHDQPQPSAPPEPQQANEATIRLLNQLSSQSAQNNQLASVLALFNSNNTLNNTKYFAEIDAERALVGRLEQEYLDDKKSLDEYDFKIAEKASELARAKDEVNELEYQLKVKRAKLDSCHREMDQLDSMKRYTAENLSKKMEMIRGKNASIDEMIRGGVGLYQARQGFLANNFKETSQELARSSSISDARDARSSTDTLVDLQQERPSITIVERSVPLTISICAEFNKKSSACRSSCPNLHCCLVCSEQHPMTSCTKERIICVKFNMDTCEPGTCGREHRCLRCSARSHRLVECPFPPAIGVEFCFAWNSTSTGCKLTSCYRSHKCIKCKGYHPVWRCPDNVPSYWSEVDGKYIAGAITANIGSVVPAPKAVATMVINEKTSVTERLVPRDDRKRGREDDYGLDKRRRSSSRDRYRSRSRDRHRSCSRERRRLTDIEKKVICRDWNNGKCEGRLPRGICRFKHVCLRCGSENHVERKCTL